MREHRFLATSNRKGKMMEINKVVTNVQYTGPLWDKLAIAFEPGYT